MNDTKIPDRLAAVDRRINSDRDPNDPVSSWLMRGHKGTGRHAAITKSLYSWHSYKNWADKVRGDWDDKDRKR
ncbi:MAG: hypothetical protein JSR95_14420 [Proteobacteria bacterium]|jgi:hypothetical protein|nr:hypothetical protein [Pseudomonadota bacterium]